MSTIRNTIGDTPDDPCGPLTNPVFSACSQSHVESWIESGNMIAARIEARNPGALTAPAQWVTRWRELVVELEARSALNPFGMNWGLGFAIMWSDTDARKAAAAVVEGADELESMGEELPIQLDVERFEKRSGGLTVADGLGIGATLALVGVAGVLLWNWYEGAKG